VELAACAVLASKTVKAREVYIVMVMSRNK
jgi:hypothetical protein